MSQVRENQCEFGCPVDKAYALVDENKIYRITFSLSLAQHIRAIYNKPLTIKRITFIVNDDKPNPKLFALVDNRKGKVLRISLFENVAKLLSDDSRSVHNCWIVKSEDVSE